MQKRIVGLPGLFVTICVLAGCFGIVHDQVTYTISPEYYTSFKFNQFSIAPQFCNRIGVAIVGWQATWWVGAYLFIIIGPFSLLLPSVKAQWVDTHKALLAMLAFTGLFSCIGLLVGWVKYSDATFRRSGLSDPNAFWVVGTIHNYSYLGGALSLFVGIGLIFWFRYKRTRKPVGDDANSAVQPLP